MWTIRYRFLLDENGKHIAKLNKSLDHAHLLVAAPNLLKALEGMVKDFENEFWKGYQVIGYIARSDPPSNYHLAIDAIRKAKGE